MRHFRYSKVMGVALLGAANTFGCDSSEQAASSPEEEIKRGELFQIAPTWPGGYIPVCWEIGPDPLTGSVPGQLRASDHPNFAALSAATRSAANRWSAAAKIRFGLWYDCPTSVNSLTPGILAIHWEDNINASSVVGYRTAGWTRMRLNPTYLNSQDPFYYWAVVMHEMGHALGFQHEFARPDAPQPGGCSGTPGSNPAAPGTSYLGTPYDFWSILNFTYCFGGSPTDISALDKAGARVAYRPHDNVLGATAPAINARGSGTLDVFIAVGSSGSGSTGAGGGSGGGGVGTTLVRQRTYSGGGWGDWRDLPALPASAAINKSPTSVSWDNAGRIDVFASTTGNRLVHTWTYDGGQQWQAWEDLGTSNSAPSVTSWASDRLDVFMNDGAGHLMLKTYAGWWYDAAPVPGVSDMQGAPAAASWGPGRLDIIYRNASSAVGHVWWDQVGWYGPESLGGAIDANTHPGASSWGAYNLNLFTISGGVVNMRQFNGYWADWTTLTNSSAYDTIVAPASGVSAASWGNGRIDIEANGTYTDAWHKAVVGGDTSWDNPY
jgi:hypothetical protein